MVATRKGGGRWPGIRRVLLLDHPITRAAQVAALARLVALIVHFFARDPNGNAVSAAPLVILPFPATYQLGAVWMVMLAWLLLWQVAPRGRRGIALAAGVTFAGIVLLSQADLLLHRHTGNSLSYSILRAYRLDRVWTADGVQPLLSDAGHSLAALLLVATATVLILRSVGRRAAAPPPAVRWGAVFAWVLLGVAAIGWRRSGAFMNQTYGVPVEARLLVGALGLDAAEAPEDPAAMREAIRALVPLRPGQLWLSDSFPLVRGSVDDLCAREARDPRCVPSVRDSLRVAARAANPDTHSRPDVVVVAIEALRGADVGYLRFPMDTTYAPHLSRLAAQSLVFPGHIANATTSPTGFFSLHCSAWRHPSRETLGEFRPRSFDCLSARLRDLGYRTMYFSASNPSFDRQLDWARPLFDVVDYGPPRPGIYNDAISERLLVDKVLGRLARHDTDPATPPFYAYITTHSTHPPFILNAEVNDLPNFLSPGSTGITPATMPDAHQRYLEILKYTDAQLERLFEALRQRPRWRNTIIVITGDHSVSLTEPDPPEQMPYDMYTWTGALLAGPRALIGPPRRDTLPSSHVDVGETLLQLVGDDRPTASLGGSLLRADRSGATSIAFYPAGYRRDYSGCTLFVSAATAARYWGQRPFRVGPPAVLPDPSCPYEAQDAVRLRALGRYWAWLVETDRVWSPEFLSRK